LRRSEKGEQYSRSLRERRPVGKAPVVFPAASPLQDAGIGG